MTEQLHPELGSGALLEALRELLGKFERHATYRLISQDETELTGNFRWLPTEKLFIEDVRYQEMLALLSLSSPIEPQAKTPVDEPKNDEREYGCYTCRKQGLKKGQRVSLVYCNECDAKHIEEVRRAARAPQASSEIREECCKAICGCCAHPEWGWLPAHYEEGWKMWAHKHKEGGGKVGSRCDASAIRALAPSRQGAAKRVEG